LQQGAPMLVHRFLSQVTKKLMVDNVVVLLDNHAALTTSALFTFVKAALEEKVQVTVHLAGGGRNLTEAVLRSASRPAAIFVLGQTATSLAKQMFVRTSLFLHTKFHWVVETTSLEDIKAELEGVDLPIYSNVLAFNGSFSDVVTLWEVYRPAPSLPPRTTAWGVWAPAGLVVLPGEKWERRVDLTGVTWVPPPCARWSSGQSPPPTHPGSMRFLWTPATLRQVQGHQTFTLSSGLVPLGTKGYENQVAVSSC
jgi:hypothetical protein